MMQICDPAELEDMICVCGSIKVFTEVCLGSLNGFHNDHASKGHFDRGYGHTENGNN